MATVREICQDALIEIGANGPADAMTAEDGAYALRVLNRMVQKWSTEELSVYTVNRDLYPLVAGTASYTLGTGGVWNAPRPARIQMAAVLVNTARPIEIPVQILTDEEWRDVSVKTTPSTFPTKIWITGNVPLNTVFCWPVPQDSTVQMVIYSWGRVNEFTSLNDTVVLPLGYEEALVTNLGMALSNSYGVQVGPALQQRAFSAKAALESLNVDPLYASFDGFGGGRSVAIATGGLQVDR